MTQFSVNRKLACRQPVENLKAPAGFAGQRSISVNSCVTFMRKLVFTCHSSYIHYGAAVKERLAVRESDCSGVPDAISVTS